MSSKMSLEQKIGFRHFEIPLAFSQWILNALKSQHGLSDDESSWRSIAKNILKMSDFYISNPDAGTPWDEEWCQVAQLSYFLPLNFIRNLAVLSEAQKLGFFDQTSRIQDWGSGLGATAQAANYLGLNVSWSEFDIHKSLSQYRAKLGLPQFKESTAAAVSFSFSLTEDLQALKLFPESQSFIIIEPSTHSDSRKLIQLRQKLIDSGFHIWAPCTHQQKCPMIDFSSDWCHDRIHFAAPDWFMEIESRLPIKNSTLTFSYLLASRTAPAKIQNGNLARTTGDQLIQNGKTLQQFCRGPEKEHLSWLHREGPAPEVSRGALIQVPENGIKKNQELRLMGSSRKIDLAKFYE